MAKKVSKIKIPEAPKTDLPDHGGIRLGRITSEAAAWMLPLLVIAILTQVLLRKAGLNQAWLDDAQWWIYGITMMFGFVYACVKEKHVRVDIFFDGFTEEKKLKTEIFALGWLLIPFLVAMCDLTLHYAFLSIRAMEGSDSPNGLHHLYLLKSAIPIIFAITIFAVFSILFEFLRRLGKLDIFHVLIGALPSIWFLSERALHYILFWIYRVLSPEIHPNAISRQPLFEWVSWVITVLVFTALILLWQQNKKNRKA